jgi:phenylalanyl-tRNA synthetase beta chain
LRVSLAWLREFVAIDLSAEKLAERLTMAGLEVEAIEPYGTYERMLVGRIVGVEPHPNADKLAIASVDVGGGELLRVVSGAPNVQAGVRVPVALVGATLSDGERVAAVEIRGVPSTAVVLSEREIGISDDHSGVMELGDDAEPGTPIAKLFGTADEILEIGVTPNRGDCLSIVGVAREISALTGARLRIPPVRLSEKGAATAEAIRVDIRDADLCHRYVARVVRAVKIGPSPLWMRSRLESLGVRAINNVVDVTNYVMLERGQPLHAFDLAKLRGGVIIVRRAAAGETVRTLDGVDRLLEPGDLVIADGEGPVAVAGVMGDERSGVGASTRDVLLESAWFLPSTVRRTSRRLGLRSEASLRFERHVDVGGTPLAADRAVELLAKLGNGEIAAGRVDAYPKPYAPTPVLIRSDRVNRLLGTSLPVTEIGQSLRRVSASVKAAGKGGYLCTPPSYRSDLTREADFVEEVARLAGYDKVPSTQPRAAFGTASTDRSRALTGMARELCASQAMNEMNNLRFVAADWNRRFPGLAPASAKPIALQNPMTADTAEMRMSLVPNLVAAAVRNRRQGEASIRAFEFGTVFWNDGEIRERQAVGGLLMGPVARRGLLAEEREESFYDAKGVVETLLEGLRVRGVRWSAADVPAFLHPGKAALVRVGDDTLGFVGGLHPRIARAADLGADAWVIELDFEKLESYASQRVTFQQLPKYPAVVRDLAIVADEGFESQAVLDTIAGCSDLPVESARLFDLYRGKPLPQGKKSLAYSIAYRSADRTLTDEEVNRFHQSLIERVTRNLGVALRT